MNLKQLMIEDAKKEINLILENHPPKGYHVENKGMLKRRTFVKDNPDLVKAVGSEWKITKILPSGTIESKPIKKRTSWI